MRASPLEYVSMGPRHRTRAVTLRCCSPAFYSFHPLTLPSHYYFPLLPPSYAIHASAYITKRRPRLADACTVLRVSAYARGTLYRAYTWTPREKENSWRVCVFASAFNSKERSARMEWNSFVAKHRKGPVSFFLALPRPNLGPISRWISSSRSLPAARPPARSLARSLAPLRSTYRIFVQAERV